MDPATQLAVHGGAPVGGSRSRYSHFLVFAARASASGDADWSALASPDNSYHLVFLHGSDTLLNLTVGGWGPNWGWTPPPVSTVAAEDGVLRLNAPWTLNKRRGDVINVACEGRQGGRARNQAALHPDGRIATFR